MSREITSTPQTEEEAEKEPLEDLPRLAIPARVSRALQRLSVPFALLHRLRTGNRTRTGRYETIATGNRFFQRRDHARASTYTNERPNRSRASLPFSSHPLENSILTVRICSVCSPERKRERGRETVEAGGRGKLHNGKRREPLFFTSPRSFSFCPISFLSLSFFFFLICPIGKYRSFSPSVIFCLLKV